MKLKIKSPSFLLAFGLLLLASVFLSRSQNDVVNSKNSVVQQVTATNPKYPEFYDPPFQSQLKSLLQGSKAETLPDSRLQIFDAKVQDFETNGQTKLVIEAPQCIYDRPAQIIDSAGPLHAQTGDGKLMIDGTGFLFLRTNGILFISNRVHTFVQAEFLQSSGSTNALAGKTPKVGDLEIASDRFVFHTNGLATYLGNASVSGTNLSIKGGSIVIVAPATDKQVKNITVETNVVMDYEKSHVEGQRVDYNAQNGIARVTGHPTWRSEEREGSANELMVDPTNKIFRATGDAYLKFSVLGLTNSNFLPGQQIAATNNAPAVTNHFVEISSDFHEFHTNSAHFGDHVALKETANNQLHGTLDCALLDVAFAGVSNELQSLVAQTNVVIRRLDTNELSAAKAVYTAETGDLELTGNPAWKNGPHQGKGNLITVNAHREEMFVRGDAWMRVPAKELGSPESSSSEVALAKPPARPMPARPSKAPEAKATGPIFSPVPGLDPPSPPGVSQKSPPSPPQKERAGESNSPQNQTPKPDEFADLYSEEYSFKDAAVRGESTQARFQRHVRIVHPQMNWTCDKLGVDSVASEKNFTMLAEGAVNFALSPSNKPPVHGACERAEYIHDLTVAPNIDRMEMTGHPVLETTNGVIHNSIIIIDQAKYIITPGEYEITGKSSALGTNLLNLMPPKR